MPIFDPPEELPVQAVRDFIDRTVNELPTIIVGAAAVLYIFGYDISEATLADVTKHVEAILGFVLWLFVRGGIDGPVTRATRDDGPGNPPEFVHYPGSFSSGGGGGGTPTVSPSSGGTVNIRAPGDD